eukprot:IDg7057t1
MWSALAHLCLCARSCAPLISARGHLRRALLFAYWRPCLRGRGCVMDIHVRASCLRCIGERNTQWVLVNRRLGALLPPVPTGPVSVAYDAGTRPSSGGDVAHTETTATVAPSDGGGPEAGRQTPSTPSDAFEKSPPSPEGFRWMPSVDVRLGSGPVDPSSSRLDDSPELASAIASDDGSNRLC